MVPELVEVVALAAVAAGGVYCGARKVRTAIWGLRKNVNPGNCVSPTPAPFRALTKCALDLRNKSANVEHATADMV